MSAPRPLSSLGDLYSWLSRGRRGPVTPSGSPSTSTSRPGRQPGTPLCGKSDQSVSCHAPSFRVKKKREFPSFFSFIPWTRGDWPINDFIGISWQDNKGNIALIYLRNWFLSTISVDFSRSYFFIIFLQLWINNCGENKIKPIISSLSRLN